MRGRPVARGGHPGRVLARAAGRAEADPRNREHRVRWCATPSDVADHAHALFEGDLAAGAAGRCILVERAVEGPEFSVEVFDGAVVAIVAKHLGPLPHFVEIGHDVPAPLRGDAAGALAGMAVRAVQALGLTWGPVHVELRASTDGPHIMEVNPRLAGGFIPEIVRLALGVDLIRATIQRVVGECVWLPRTRRGCASIRFLTGDVDGILAGVSGLAEASALPGITDVQCYRRTGDPCLRQFDFRDRLGHVIAAGRDHAAVGAALAEAVARIRLRIASPRRPPTASAPLATMSVATPKPPLTSEEVMR